MHIFCKSAVKSYTKKDDGVICTSEADYQWLWYSHFAHAVFSPLKIYQPEMLKQEGDFRFLCVRVCSPTPLPLFCNFIGSFLPFWVVRFHNFDMI